MKFLFLIACFFICFIKAYAQLPGDQTFNAAYIHNVDILINSPMWWDSLQYYKKLRDSTGITTYMHCDVKINGIAKVKICKIGMASIHCFPRMTKTISLEAEKTPKQTGNKTADISVMVER